MKKIIFICLTILFSSLAFAQAVEGASESNNYSEDLEISNRICTVYGFKDEADLDQRFYDVIKLCGSRNTESFDLAYKKLLLEKDRSPSNNLLDFMTNNNYEYASYFVYSSESKFDYYTGEYYTSKKVTIYLIRKFNGNIYSISQTYNLN
jgi:hypothetical protein